jgi:hypothetical protein
MKNKIFASLVVAVMSLTAEVSLAKHIECMPKVMSYVLEDFYKKRETTGLEIVLQNRYTGYKDTVVNLGKDVSEESVKIADIGKQMYRLDIRIQYIGLQAPTGGLTITFYVEMRDYATCTLESDQKLLVYRGIGYDFNPAEYKAVKN